MKNLITTIAFTLALVGCLESKKGGVSSTEDAQVQADPGSGSGDVTAGSDVGPDTSPPECQDMFDCDDGDPCTNDTCGFNFRCYYQEIQNCARCQTDEDCGMGGGVTCEDNFHTSYGPACIDGQCQTVEQKSVYCSGGCDEGGCICDSDEQCNDKEICTDDLCVDGYCQWQPGSEDEVCASNFGLGQDLLCKTGECILPTFGHCGTDADCADVYWGPYCTDGLCQSCSQEMVPCEQGENCPEGVKYEGCDPGQVCKAGGKDPMPAYDELIEKNSSRTYHFCQ